MNLAFNMDCMVAMREMEDKSFDLAIVDPPYGIRADEVQNQQAASGRVSNGGRWRQYKPTRWDSAIPTDLYFHELRRVSKHQIIWGGNYFTLAQSGVVIWDKGVNGKMKEGELALTSFPTFKMFRMSRIDAYVNSGEEKIHPTQKPVDLYKWILENYAKPNDKILDTHLGSGSSRIAAYDLGFDFVGYELDKDYFDAQEQRFMNHTTQQGLFQPEVVTTTAQTA